MYSFKKAAEEIGVSRNTLAKLVEEHEIEVVYLPKQKRLTKESVEVLKVKMNKAKSDEQTEAK